MGTINQQSILKAFYRFDQKHIPLTNIEGTPVADPRDIGARQQLCKLWLEAFDGLDTAVWERVIEVVQNQCKEYPSVDVIYQIIERITTEPSALELEAQQKQEAVIPKNQAPQKPKSMPENKKLKAMFELAKQGKFIEAQQVVHAGIPYAQIVEYAKKHWPDCTQGWIAANQHELAELVHNDIVCYNCFSVQNCPTHGYCSYGRIDKFHGGLSVMTARCMKTRKDDAK